MAYTMYSECAEGGLHRLWKLDKPMGATEFQDRVGTQMSKYELS